MRSINAFPRSLRRSMVLCFAGLFVVLAHIFAQSVITTYVGPQMPVSGSPALNQAIDYPTTVVPDGTGGLYVLSTNQNRVYAIDGNGTLTLVAGSTYGFSGDGGSATDARLASPSGLARDAMGNLYIADSGNQRIRKVTAGSVITTVAGTGTAGFSGDGGPAVAAQLWGPTGLAVDAVGNLYIVDIGNKRIRRVSVDGVISTVAGGASIAPSAVAVDAAGNLYIATKFDRPIGSGFVQRVGPDGTISLLTSIPPIGGPFSVCLHSGDGGPSTDAVVCSPNGLSVDAAGSLYVAEWNRVSKITTDGLIHTVAGAGGETCNLNAADGSPATSVCLSPSNVAVGADGSLYFSEAPGNLVRKVAPNGVLTTILANTIIGFAGDGGPATSAKLFGASAVALDAGGNLYIADIQNMRVRKVTTDGAINTIAGSGIHGVAGDGGPAASAEMGAVRDVFIDNSGNIYINDYQRVRKITTDGVINTIAGCYSVCPAPQDEDGVMATDAPLGNPQVGLTINAIVVDDAGTLYIAELDRVRKVDANGIITTIISNGSPEWGGPGGPPGITQSNTLTFRGFAVDTAGSFYVGGSDNRIRKMTPDGQVTIIAGSGDCSFTDSGDGGPAISAPLCNAPRMKLDAAGNLFVVEGYRVRKITPDGIIRTVAGGNSVQGFSGDGGAATAAQFNSLQDVAVDAAGNLYIADYNRIRKVFPSTATQPFSLAGSSLNYQTTIPLSGPIAVGYGTVQPVAPNTTPSGIAVYSYRANGVLVSETAVPASPLRQSGRIFAESTGAVRTGIAIANPNDQDAVISFYFTDKNGVNLNSGTTTLPAHEQTAVFLDQRPYLGTSVAQTFTFNSSIPVGAVALRSYVNERSEALMTTLPVAPVSSTASPSAGTIVLPHFAAGGGWTTQVLLVNPTDQPLSGTVNMDAAYAYTIAPRSSVKITSASSDLLRTGNIVITPAQGSGLPIASSVFSFVNNGITVTETGIATTGVAPGFQVFAESDSGQRFQTGIAVANTAATAAKIQFELLTSDGQSTGYTGSTTLDPNGHMALFLNQIPGMQNLPSSFRGVLAISSNTPISGIGLRTRYNERGDFLISTTPAIADNTPPSASEFVFPQVVSGSGYTTDFILMNPVGTSQGTLTLTSQAGAALPLFVP